MEWLRKKLGEENYKKLSNEVLEILKTSLGEVEYIENDPLKVIPKYVFNEKIQEVKMLNETIANYKEQLKNTSNLISDNDMKIKLAEQEQAFKTQLKEAENKFNSELTKQRKENLLLASLQNSGCMYPDLLIKNVNFESLIEKDGKLLNPDDVINPLKETYKTLFEIKLNTNNNLTKGTNNFTPVKTSKQEMIEKYNKAMETGEHLTALQISRQIKEFKEE